MSYPSTSAAFSIFWNKGETPTFFQIWLVDILRLDLIYKVNMA